MVGANLEAEKMALMDKRAAMETEMDSIVERLCVPGGPGLSGDLIDSEGFPRTDIDIPVVRAERRRLTELRNEHIEITGKINDLSEPTTRASSTTDSGPEQSISSGEETSLSASMQTAGFSVTSLSVGESSELEKTDSERGKQKEIITKEEEDQSAVPDELVRKIVESLPLDSALRLCTVSLDWLSMISTKNYAVSKP